LVDCIQMAEDIKLPSLPGSPIVSSFIGSQYQYPIPRGTPFSGGKNRWGGEHLQF